MALIREDVERIVRGVLSKLEVKVDGGYFTNPNSRTISLVLDGEVISRTEIDIRQRSEYEG